MPNIIFFLNIASTSKFLYPFFEKLKPGLVYCEEKFTRNWLGQPKLKAKKKAEK